MLAETPARYQKALVEFLRWTRAEQPTVYAHIVRGLQEQGQHVDLASLGFLDIVGSVLSLANSAAGVYGNVKGAQDAHDLMKANIARLKAGAAPATSLYTASSSAPAKPAPSSPPMSHWPWWTLPLGALLVLVPIGFLVFRRGGRR